MSKDGDLQEKAYEPESSELKRTTTSNNFFRDYPGVFKRIAQLKREAEDDDAVLSSDSELEDDSCDESNSCDQDHPDTMDISPRNLEKYEETLSSALLLLQSPPVTSKTLLTSALQVKDIEQAYWQIMKQIELAGRSKGLMSKEYHSGRNRVSQNAAIIHSIEDGLQAEIKNLITLRDNFTQKWPHLLDKSKPADKEHHVTIKSNIEAHSIESWQSSVWLKFNNPVHRYKSYEDKRRADNEEVGVYKIIDALQLYLGEESDNDDRHYDGKLILEEAIYIYERQETPFYLAQCLQDLQNNKLIAVMHGFLSSKFSSYNLDECTIQTLASNLVMNNVGPQGAREYITHHFKSEMLFNLVPLYAKDLTNDDRVQEIFDAIDRTLKSGTIDRRIVEYISYEDIEGINLLVESTCNLKDVSPQKSIEFFGSEILLRAYIINSSPKKQITGFDIQSDEKSYDNCNHAANAETSLQESATVLTGDLGDDHNTI